MALDGMIVDLEGVLIDARPARVRAWTHAFDKFGYAAPHDRIAMELGRGTADLPRALLGADVAASQGSGLLRAYRGELARIIDADRLPVAAGAADLLRELGRRGIETAVVTTSPREEVERIERASGFAVREKSDVFVCGDDVASASARDTIQFALERLGMCAAQCAFVGDTRAEIRAARRVGLITIGTAKNGSFARALRSDGARMVVRDAAAILRRIDRVIRRSSPGSARFDRATLERLVREALAVAEENAQKFREPIGAVVARGDGSIVARAGDLTETHGPLAHAEMEALRAAAPHLVRGELGAILVSSREPCAMCVAAATEMGVDMVLFAKPSGSASDHSGFLRMRRGHDAPRVVGGFLAEEANRIEKRFAAEHSEPRAKAPSAASTATRARRARGHHAV